MFCRNCGMKMMIGVSTCPACGKPVLKEENEESGTRVYDPQNLNTNMVTYKKETQKTPSKNYGLIFVLIILFILLVGALIKFFNIF